MTRTMSGTAVAIRSGGIPRIWTVAVIVRLTFPDGQESFEAVDNFTIVEDDDGALKIAVDSYAFVGND